jgi:hypothetical protein
VRDRERVDDFRRAPALLRLDFFPLAPPVCLFTVAHAIRSAVFVLRPRRLALFSMCEAMRFCLEL